MRQLPPWCVTVAVCLFANSLCTELDPLLPLVLSPTVSVQCFRHPLFLRSAETSALHQRQSGARAYTHTHTHSHSMAHRGVFCCLALSALGGCVQRASMRIRLSHPCSMGVRLIQHKSHCFSCFAGQPFGGRATNGKTDQGSEQKVSVGNGNVVCII